MSFLNVTAKVLLFLRIGFRIIGSTSLSNNYSSKNLNIVSVNVKTKARKGYEMMNEKTKETDQSQPDYLSPNLIFP